MVGTGAAWRPSSPVTGAETGPLAATHVEIAEHAGAHSAELAGHVMVAVSMPKLGSSADGTVEGWFKQVGDYVQAGDLLLVVSEARFPATEVRAPISGFLREVIIPTRVTVAAGVELGIIEAVPEAGQAERYQQQVSELNQPSAVSRQSPHMPGPRSSSKWHYTGEISSVTMPRVEGSGPEGTVLRWLKQVGEYIDIDEPVVNITTDMVDIMVPAPGSGFLGSIFVAEDECVPARTVLGVIEGAIEEKAKPIPNVTATRPMFTLKAPAWMADTARPTILRWLKPAGSRIELHESLLEVTTDYFDVAMECPVAGTLYAILAAEDEIVEVGAELALIDIIVQPGTVNQREAPLPLLSLGPRRDTAKS